MKKPFSISTSIFKILLLTFLVFGEKAICQKKEIPSEIAAKIAEGIYLHSSKDANITIVQGEEGLLIIDTGYPDRASYTDSLIRSTFKKNVKYIINTHLHFDHVGGNFQFSDSTTTIIAHENTRERMMEEWSVPKMHTVEFPVIPPYPDEFLPDICFSESMQVHINGDILNLVKMPNGHSNSDIVVQFQEANIIVTGDLFISIGFYPFECTIAEYLLEIDQLISMCNDATIIIPGHGPVSDLKGLQLYRKALQIGADRINTLKSEGKTLEEVIASQPLNGLMEKSTMPEEVFIYCCYYGPIVQH